MFFKWASISINGKLLWTMGVLWDKQTHISTNERLSPYFRRWALFSNFVDSCVTSFISFSNIAIQLFNYKCPWNLTATRNQKSLRFLNLGTCLPWIWLLYFGSYKEMKSRWCLIESIIDCLLMISNNSISKSSLFVPQ